MTVTDKLMKDGVSGVWWWNVVIGIDDSQLCGILKRMLIEAQQEQNTTKSLAQTRHVYTILTLLSNEMKRTGTNYN